MPTFIYKMSKIYSLSFLMMGIIRHDISPVRSSSFDFMPSSLDDVLQQYETDINTTVAVINNLGKKSQDNRLSSKKKKYTSQKRLCHLYHRFNSKHSRYLCTLFFMHNIWSYFMPISYFLLELWDVLCIKNFTDKFLKEPDWISWTLWVPCFVAMRMFIGYNYVILLW